jgi:hypothetical protein
MRLSLKHEGELLSNIQRLSIRRSLYSLTSLSDAAAESLSKYKGEFSLNGLTSLSDAAAESLSKHEGRSITVAIPTDEIPDLQAREE